MVCPVAESTPENLMSCRSGGSCPICEVEGVKPIAIADCRGNAPSMPTPGSMLPISHVTPLSFWLKVRFSESGLKMPTHRTYDGRIAVSFAFSILFVMLVSVNTIPYVVSVPALGGRGPTLVNGFAKYRPCAVTLRSLETATRWEAVDWRFSGTPCSEMRFPAAFTVKVRVGLIIFLSSSLVGMRNENETEPLAPAVRFERAPFVVFLSQMT